MELVFSRNSWQGCTHEFQHQTAGSYDVIQLMISLWDVANPEKTLIEVAGETIHIYSCSQVFFGYPLVNIQKLWKITMFNGKTHYKWPFSIAMLVYQRVICNTNLNMKYEWSHPSNMLEYSHPDRQELSQVARACCSAGLECRAVQSLWCLGDHFRWEKPWNHGKNTWKTVRKTRFHNQNMESWFKHGPMEAVVSWAMFFCGFLTGTWGAGATNIKSFPTRRYMGRLK